MMSRVVLLLTLILHFHEFSILAIYANEKLSQFEDSVKKECPDIKILLLKKSLLEFVKAEQKGCNGVFTSKLLETCSKLNCNKIEEFYSKASTVSLEGRVVGD